MDVVTFGETMVLFNPETEGPLRYVGAFTKSIGGAESNVAIALARLGHHAGWFSKLGDDEFGRYIKSTVMGEEVDVSRVTKDPARTTGILFKERFSTVNPNVYYYRKGSAASHLSISDLDMDYICSAKILHVTGISLALSEEVREAVFYAVKEAKKRGVIISFDPNIRLKLWSKEDARKHILALAELSDIIFPGKDEAELLLGTDEPLEVCQRFLDMGIRIVALKLGKTGCYVKSKDEEGLVSGYTVEHPVDTVGAGDGYAAGFLSGYLEELSLIECAKRANAVGAMATLVKGDMEGFPYKDQVEIFMGLKDNIDR
ncbi:MAG TPA: sugar kinase [Clostridiaceae bacterium]|nr:sugar kinase [Clostridiaceae bacterium]